jgi:hypothetical protein
MHMKRITIYAIITTSIFLAILMVLSPRSVVGSKSTKAAGPGTELADSIQKFVQRACMDCHADDGNSMARGKVNFSKWASYDAEKQAKKANAICKQLSKSSMPPKKWRTNNPKDVPTQAEVDMVCRWSKSLQK